MPMPLEQLVELVASQLLHSDKPEYQLTLSIHGQMLKSHFNEDWDVTNWYLRNHLENLVIPKLAGMHKKFIDSIVDDLMLTFKKHTHQIVEHGTTGNQQN